MAQLVKPQLAAPDYDSTIIGALELSEKKWVLAVQVPGVKRHSRYVVEARGDELTALIERLILLRHELLWQAIFAGRIALQHGH
jgi:hypothetical protein